MNLKTKFILFFAPMFLMLVSAACKNESDTENSLLVYCAAGTKPVIQKVAQEYYREFGVRIDLQYGGSGTLLSNLRIAKQGDLYLAADKSYIDEAITHGLLDETQPLAYIRPVVGVLKGNPKELTKKEDLIRPNVKIGLANPDAASIGRLSKKMLTELGTWNGIQGNLSVLLPTVNEVANSIKLGAIDAGIIWDATANQYDEIDIVPIQEFKPYIKNITIGVLKYTEQATESLRFMRYLSARDKGLLHFKSLGYEPVVGDLWQDKPKILLYSGGVNRLAIENSIRRFEEREGVEVIRVYNGCGILVSQMKAGQQPDAYLSCDTSFMTQVEERFHDIRDISQTEIVIVTKKGNPNRIERLEDLRQPGLQLGVCNHDQSALGALTKKLLESKNLWEDIEKNIRSQTPTADLLVNQIRTGSLDAVIVYEANIATLKDKLNVVRLKDKEAKALQNFGISVQADQQYLLKRLFNALTDETSKSQYVKNGFQWEFNQQIENR